MKQNRGRLSHEILAHGVLGLWSVGLIGVGSFFLDQRWGLVSLGAGATSAAVVVLGIRLRSWVGAGYGVMLVAAAAMLAAGALHANAALVGLGLLGLLTVGSSLAVSIRLAEIGPPRGPEPVAPAARGEALLAQILETATLSDSAKRVLYRDRDMQLLRSAIEADISRGAYDVAWTLCGELAELYGCREEAEAFRSRIAQSRHEHYETRVLAALEHLEDLLAERNWAAVHQEAARIRRLYPDSHLLADLDKRILDAREEHKRHLEGRFLEAARRDDVEEAMPLLKQLDRYLSREEAGRLAEVAEGVVVKRRENLGAQFKLAVNDRQWVEAARVGETIIDEFPNAKMAEEVRSMIDILRTRAGQPAVAAEGGG